ncbi:DUF1134 domain-containing protein [Camelimonas abortus]|uniref:DUF1134 domain-containing protein n=1 Tax=Camelimonas abortus TaxID=1017184 RepID=A0ABV7LDX2_9HYPH
MKTILKALLLVAAALLTIPMVTADPAAAQNRPIRQHETFRAEEIIAAGHGFFGELSKGLALAVQEAFRRWGAPNGYILGQEGSGAFIGGLRYGEGVLYTRNAGQMKVFWQGPSVGFDWGGDGARTMMLVYNMPTVQSIFTRFLGLNGSAYFIGGFGVSAAVADNMVVVPIRAGVGARLGVNIGYLKFTPNPTWNPF